MSRKPSPREELTYMIRRIDMDLGQEARFMLKDRIDPELAFASDDFRATLGTKDLKIDQTGSGSVQHVVKLTLKLAKPLHKDSAIRLIARDADSADLMSSVILTNGWNERRADYGEWRAVLTLTGSGETEVDFELTLDDEVGQ